MKLEKEIYLSGGCFWGVEVFFKKIPGVCKTTCGYANGQGVNPSYEDVCKGNQSFVECVHIIYDSDILTLNKILKAFFMIIDPTSINKQGGDAGIQYRTGIYTVNQEDIDESMIYMNEIRNNYQYPIVTEIMPLSNFYPAESYHQDYLDKNPQGYCHINLGLADAFIKEQSCDK